MKKQSGMSLALVGLFASMPSYATETVDLDEVEVRAHYDNAIGIFRCRQ